MNRRVVRLLTSVVIAVVIAAAMTWGVGLAWTAIGGGAMSLHGWIALTLDTTLNANQLISDLLRVNRARSGQMDEPQ